MTMTERAGRTEKISISLRREDLAALRRRAKRLNAGNLSAVIAELAADAERFEKMHELVDRLGGAILTDADREALDAAWGFRAPPRAKRRKKSSKATA